MQAITEMLVDGERELGRYQVGVVRRSRREWSSTIPPLNVLTTNYRLILWPQTLKPYPPASIPCTYLIEAREIDLDTGRGLLLRLSTGHRIYLRVTENQRRSLARDIRRMTRPPRGNPIFGLDVARRDVLRLIHYLRTA